MKMEKKFNRIFALLIIALLFTGSVVTTHFLSAADGSDELPVAVDGAILSPIVTGDTVDWVEIARYNDSTGNYSLIVRTTYLTVRSNNQDEPEFQYTQYSSDDTINYSQSYVRRFINEWFNGGARADELPANARLRDFTMESNAKKVLGTSLTEEALADGFSTPTFNQARTGEDVAFALSYSETAEFLSKIYFLRDQTQTMYSNDIASANFDKITLPKSEHSCMWLRTAGDTNNFAGSLSYMGYAFQDYNGPQTNGYVYPALWVRTSLFDTSYTVHYYLYGTDVSVKADKEMTNQTIGQSITEEAAKIPGYMVLEPSSVTKTLNPSNNEFTFYYTQNTDMTYTVHYYLQGTNTPLQAAKIVTGQTMGAQVIENAVDIAGYTAVDPVSVTLTIKAAGNEIVFNYGPDTYTIDYVDNIAGAAVSGKAVTTYNITSAVTLHTLEKNGYTFNGWYAGSDFTGSAVTAFGPRVIGDKTFYAKWGDGSGNPDEYPIIYAGVSDAEHSNPETYNVTSDITFKSAERFGYRFDGWFEEPSFTTPRTGIAAGTTGSVTVYAKMTLTEYDVIYDANGGAGGPGTETTAPVPNYALNTTTFPAHDRDGGYNVLFMGWSLTQSAIIDKDGTVPVLVAEVTIDDKDVTVYAVWGYDKNGDGTPDVREKQYSILYHVNGGNDNGPANETGLIAGTYTLNTTTRPTHAQDNGYDVLFMGWSLTQTGIIDKDGTVPDLVTQVTIVDKDVTFYAVWGYDKNSDGRPDVREVKHNLYYHVNGGNDNGPANETGLIAGTYTLNTTTRPTHAQDNGYDVLFMGWSLTQTGIIDKDGTVPDLVTQVTINDKDMTVYAVWGYDKNSDGRPDVREVKHNLYYHVNGGNDNGPANETGLIAGTYTLNTTTRPTHAQDNGYDVLFMGWSLTQTGIIDKDGTVPDLVIQVTIDDKDVTVYAVWGYDKNSDGRPDVREVKHNLYYHVNGGNDNGPANETGLIAGTYTLNNTTRPTHAQDNGYDVLFMGWSLTQTGIIDKDGTVPNLVTQVTINDKDMTVYAVWGYDKNSDGRPDVREVKHNLYYHVNGGNDNGPANETGLIAGKYTLNTTTFPTHAQDNGYDVLFMGWSLTQTGIIDKDGTVPALVTAVTINDKDVTVYAVWGYDKNGDGTPDVREKQYSILYHVNGGNGNGPANETGLIAGTYTLNNTTLPTHAQDNGYDVLFMGWSLTQVAIIDKDGTVPALVTAVTINDKDVTVYAVWGYDKNSDGRPDVNEKQYSLFYHVNGGNDNGPENETGLIAGTYTLNTATRPTHAQDGGYNVLFIGWSLTQVTIIDKDGTVPALATKVTIDDKDVTVYAVWGYDKNGDGIPDVMEGKHNLFYHVNGGNENGPANETGLIAGTYTLNTTTPPTHAQDGGNNVLFMGWSLTQAGIIDKDGTVPALATKVTIDDKDVTVYAVWGYDKNGDGTPDVNEKQYSLLYHVNGGNDNGPANETGLIAGTYTLNTTTLPTHAQDGGYNVLFMGWSLTQVAVIDKDGTIPALAAKVTIDDKDATVYAVWGYDKNGDGTPDVNEKQYNILYHVNGGNDNGPKNETGLIAGTYTLNGTTFPTHAQDGGYDVLFMGWSLTQVAVIDKDGTVPALVTEVTIDDKDATVYAVWGYDKNGDGTPDVNEKQYNILYHVNGGNDNGPANETGLIAGTYTLNGTTHPTHAQDDGYDVLFMGWSLTQAGIIDKDGTVPALVTEVTIDDKDVTVYAVWGYDKNGDGTPDVNEKQYNLFYHVNGGNDNGPKNETGLIAGTYTLNTTTHPMHAPDGGYNVLFMGWSLTQVAVIDKDGTVPALAAKVTIADKDVTVYAVWGYDKNDDGIPDVMEGKHSLFYHVNGGNDDGPKNETGLFAGTYTLNNTTFPTHDRDGGYNVLFMGWSLTQAGIIDKAGAVPVLAAKVTIDDNDVTVYAVWGFDKDNNGIPDVLDKDPKASGSGTGGALVVTPGAGPSLSGPSQNPNQTQNQGQNQTSNLPPSDSSQSPLKDYLPLTVLLLFMIAVGIFLFMWKRRNDEDEEKQKQE